MPHRAGADPSESLLMVLDPPGVSWSAAFLATVSFDDLWSRAGAEVRDGGRDEAQAREEFPDHHRGLRGFNGRAAAAGHAVVKVVWA
ncbi:hypothetical protein ACPCTK_20650 [Streptomyces pseudogriseolus]|uniref:hypothetical protein n=1 Tax=Streptomyces pseudogriseolus TaxID=36817 RepID=UPI003FA2DDBE